MILTNIKDNNRKKALTFIELMGEKLSYGNSDGLGYAALDTEDRLFGERWFSNKEAFKTSPKNSFNNRVKLKESGYSSFGEKNLTNVSAILLHTRFATCERTLANVHPFVKEDTALIHNGVIRNPEKYAPTISTCDSESLLNGYLQYDIANAPEELEAMVSPLEGYWATAVMAKLNGKYIIDIFKYGASLEAVYIYDLEAWVFSTNATDIENICDRMKMKYSDSGEVLSNSHLRLDPHTGETLFSEEYEKKTIHHTPTITPPYTRYSGVADKKEEDVGTKSYSEWQEKNAKNAKIERITTKQFHEYIHGIKH
jgi:hypothetical protein